MSDEKKKSKCRDCISRSVTEYISRNGLLTTVSRKSYKYCPRCRRKL